MNTEQAKSDTGYKFYLGGLIIEAGLSTEEPTVLLGMLTSAQRVLSGQTGGEARRRWKEIGEQALGAGPPR
jgi:hypothetical protein